ncbi:MAG: hypothetical protein NTY07_14135 [Bacteroidia bacterium]|nr:hypothetical protein [Bacteroidia bacterium]
MKKLLFGILIVASGLVFYACNEKSGFLGADALKTNANELVANDTQVENVVETSNYEADIFSLGNSTISAFSIGLKSGEIGGGLYKNMFERFPNFKLRYRGGICPDLTITSTNGGYPKTMTINYGDSLHLANGHILKGKIIVVLSAAPFVSGSTRTVTFDNFCTDSVCLSGTIVKTRTTDVNPKFSEKSDLTVTLPNGTTINRTEEKVKNWIAGSDTEFNPADDVIEITGKVVVSDSKGNGYSKTITTPLLKTGECKFITKGVIEYKSNSGKFATVNYGNGDCDNKATRTTQNGTTVIILGRM